MRLSKESQMFIENLRLYLFSTGKAENDIHDIVAELEDHLLEAEKRGKSVEDVIGQSPKEYMEQLAKEMGNSYKEWRNYAISIIITIFAYVVMGDVIRGETSYTWIEMIGYPLSALFTVFLIFKAFKFLASHNLTTKKQMGLFALVSMISIGSFVLVISLSQFYGATVVSLNSIGDISLFIISAVVFIISAIWSKTWIPIMIPTLLYLPEFLMDRFTTIEKLYQIIISYLISMIGISIYFFILWFRERRNTD